MNKHTDFWKNRTEAKRHDEHKCRRCGVDLDPGLGDTRQFCREHQDEQNATNRRSRNAKGDAA